MTIKSISLIVATLIITSLAGCATLFKGSSETVTINSNVPGTQVYINGLYRGVTPLSIPLRTSKGQVIQLKKLGYATKTVAIGTHVDVVYVVLDVLFGVWPAVIDLVTGAWNSFDMKYITGNMQPAGQGYESPQPAAPNLGNPAPTTVIIQQ